MLLCGCASETLAEAKVDVDFTVSESVGPFSLAEPATLRSTDDRYERATVLSVEVTRTDLGGDETRLAASFRTSFGEVECVHVRQSLRTLYAVGATRTVTLACKPFVPVDQIATANAVLITAE
jgi:hypothetical protein